jgi:hypothetical protein
MAARIPRTVKKWSARPFTLKDRLPNQAVQPIQGEGTPVGAAPRIQPATGQRQYGKTRQATGNAGPGFGSTGLTGES